MRPYADTNFFTRYYLEMAESAVVAALAGEAERRGPLPLPVTYRFWSFDPKASKLAALEGLKTLAATARA